MNNYRLVWALLCTFGIILSTGQVTQAAPVNDSCANALPISDVVNQSFDTSQATIDGTYHYSKAANIWYCYTATCTGTVTVDLAGSSYDTMLAVYDGCQCPTTSAQRIAYNDDINYPYDKTSKLTFSATCGNQYLIEVGGYMYYKGPGKISISCSGTSCAGNNDDCQDAQSVGNVPNLAFDTIDASHDGIGDCMSGPNIWYLYTATCNGQAVISVCGNFDTALAAYTGTNCNNLTQILFACSDDSSGVTCSPSYSYQSQVTINVNNGQSYWIEVGGKKSNDRGQGVLSISCNGQVDEAADLGDAPDSTNHYEANMRTYDHYIIANFPTVYNDGSGTYGPKHLHPMDVAFLGDDVSFEDEADTGYDEDPEHNIEPTWLHNNQDNDLDDDAVDVESLVFSSCDLNAFQYVVTVIDPDVDMWVNVWIDWNQDGDWNDDGTNDQDLNCDSCTTDGVVSEWAVQNQFLYDLELGQNIITTPGFLGWKPANQEHRYSDVWMRITLSEEPWTGGTGGQAGSGPASGYQYGETEDYYFEPPSDDCFICEDLNNDGIVDYYDLYTYLVSWIYECDQ